MKVTIHPYFKLVLFYWDVIPSITALIKSPDLGLHSNVSVSWERVTLIE